ncbi:hypothetical protein LTR47_006816 [Exophiala xenobiotica]|nr:hypothetical protein LTR47_006816 [Exophiala xenobiotica]KAK5250684.1 hypothetical protein LTS06_004568 [Exophiala xenobiotica]KAK5390895.1 hypothetical protein LTS03_000265 [Exophiala xenobiotica]
MASTSTSISTPEREREQERERDPALLPGSTSTSTSTSYKCVLSTLTPPSTPHTPLSLPVSPAKPHIPSHAISSLQVHPVIEAALHLLNLDLPSAHFLAPPAWEAMYAHGILHRLEGDIDNARAWYGDVKDAQVFQAVWGGGEGDTLSGDADGDGDGDRDNSTSSSSSSSHADANGGTNNNNNNQAFNKACKFLDQVEIYKSSILSSSSSSSSSSSKATSGPAPSSTSPAPADMIRTTSLAELNHFLKFCERKFTTAPILDASSVWTSMADKHKDQAAQMITGGEGWREF